MNIREDVIYARQSVDRKDSISIESQIDFCKYELKGGSCRVFKDKGYSGKNTDRPEFQKLLGEIRKGKVRRVVVYKLDRISRSILDFANMMELFQEYDVEFVSSTEKFDTSTPMGRAMLNICIVFAQLEREALHEAGVRKLVGISQRCISDCTPRTIQQVSHVLASLANRNAQFLRHLQELGIIGGTLQAEVELLADFSAIAGCAFLLYVSGVELA